MPVAELDSIEWRGLAVRSINVRGNGMSLELDSVPNSLGGFSTAILDLSDADSMDLQVNDSCRLPISMNYIFTGWPTHRRARARSAEVSV